MRFEDSCHCQLEGDKGYTVTKTMSVETTTKANKTKNILNGILCN